MGRLGHLYIYLVELWRFRIWGRLRFRQLYNIRNRGKVNIYHHYVIYHQYTASDISYHLTEANLIDPVEEIPSIVATKAAEASDGDTTESGSAQGDDDYTASIATALSENGVF